jgi:hypothetical protein
MSRSYISSPPCRLHGGSGTALLCCCKCWQAESKLLFWNSSLICCPSGCDRAQQQSCSVECTATNQYGIRLLFLAVDCLWAAVCCTALSLAPDTDNLIPAAAKQWRHFLSLISPCQPLSIANNSSHPTVLSHQYHTLLFNYLQYSFNQTSIVLAGSCELYLTSGWIWINLLLITGRCLKFIQAELFHFYYWLLYW